MNDTRDLSRREFLTRTAVAGAVLAAAGPATLHAQSKAVQNRYKIIAFSKPFQKFSFDETAELVADVGWDGIECPVRPKGQIEPERAPEELPKLVEALKKRGKEVTLITTGIKNVSEPHTEKVLRTASRLGIKRYRLSFWKYAKDKSIPDQLREIQAELRDLAALNKELGLQAGMQNHSGADYVGGPVWDVYSIIKDLDPRQMGFCFDIGHATLEGGYSWPTEARLAQPFFTAVFVKDFFWQKTDKGWKAKWCALGEGMVNPAFFKWLKTTPFNGPISQHHEYEIGTGKEMVAHMKKDLQVLQEWLGT